MLNIIYFFPCKNPKYYRLSFVLIFFVIGLILTPALSATTKNKSKKENLIYVTWGDHIMVDQGVSKMDTPEKIAKCLEFWRQFNGKTILWRVSSYIAKKYNVRRSTSPYAKSYKKKVDSIFSKFDPADVVRKYTKKNNQKFLLYLTVLDHGAPVSDLYGGNTPFPFQDKYTIKHPDIQAKDLNGNYHNGVLEFAYPEARKLMVDRIKNIVEKYQADGVYVCTRTHSLPALHADQFGFSNPVIKDYKDKYGIDISKDPRFNYKSEKFAPQDVDVEKWRHLRGEYFVQFFRELRRALPGKIIYLGIPRGDYIGPPYGNMYLDYKSIIKNKLVDGIVLRVFAGIALHMPLYVNHKKIGYLSSEDEGFGLPDKMECMEKIYGPLCKKNGVKCFYNDGGYGISQMEWLNSTPNLTGMMLAAPPIQPSVYVKHNKKLCDGDLPLTIEAFINPVSRPEHNSFPRIVSKYGHRSNSFRGWEWYLNNKMNLGFRLNVVYPNGKSNDILVESKKAISTTQWTHLATVYDPKRKIISIYVNGKLDVRKQIPLGAKLRLNVGQDMLIGAYAGTGVRKFKGLIDEFRISQRAIEFNSKPVKPYLGNEKGTVILCHFDKTKKIKFVDVAAPGIKSCMISLPSGILADSLPGFGKALNLTGKAYKKKYKSDLPLTIEAFINPVSRPKTNSFPRIISKYGHHSNAARGWEWVLNNKMNLDFRLNVVYPNGKSNDILLTSKTAISPTQWTHLATVYNPKQKIISIYVNGKLDARKQIPLGAKLKLNAGQDIFLGAYGGTESKKFKGLMDELRISQRAIEFNTKPVKPYLGNEKGTVILCHFDKANKEKYINMKALVDSLPGFGKALDLKKKTYKALPVKDNFKVINK